MEKAMKKRSLLFVICLFFLMTAVWGCNDDKEPAPEAPTATGAPEASATPEGEPSPSPTAVPDKVEYTPKEDRLDKLTLSSDNDKYEYQPDADAAQYDVSYSLTVQSESGTQSGEATVESSVSGFDGDGYVFLHDASTKDSASVTVSVPADGFYRLTFTIATPMGEKANDILLDGVSIGEVSCPKKDTFEEYPLDGIYITRGEHELTIQAVWGWIYYDSVTVSGVEQPKPEDKELTTAVLVDSYATLRTKMLYQFICDIDGRYTLSGQYAQKGMSSNEFAAIQQAAGRTPAILGVDLIDYSPSRASHSMPDNVIQRAINFYQKEGGIVTVSWHWNAPAQYIRQDAEWWEGFRSEAVDMDLTAIMNGKDPEGYEALMKDIDSIAFYLKQIAEEDVPILWRPLHEASGGWFWWGNFGADTYCKLWKAMYDRLVNYHGIHNLIWVWNGQDAAWYPGDAYVDMIGEDIYPGNRVYSSQSIKYNEASAYTDKELPVVLSENGCLADPDLMIRDNARWTWFCVWSGEFVVDGAELSEVYNEAVMWDKVYNHNTVLTLDELPDLTTYGQ